jgi:DNA-binding NarL/FixJ family response regulator
VTVRTSREAPSRVLLADDHALVRSGVRLIIDAEPDLEVVAEVADGQEALDRLRSGDDVDLAVLDISMPRMTGLQAARALQQQGPQVPVLILSMHDNEQYLYEALKHGALGYVHKSLADRDLIAACRAAVRGEPFLYPNAVTSLIKHRLAHDDPVLGAGLLTPREEEVLKLIAEGHSTREIAHQLVVSPKTVERHRSNLLEKLGMRDRVELTRYAIRVGLIEP